MADSTLSMSSVITDEERKIIAVKIIDKLKSISDKTGVNFKDVVSLFLNVYTNNKRLFLDYFNHGTYIVINADDYIMNFYRLSRRGMCEIPPDIFSIENTLHAMSEVDKASASSIEKVESDQVDEDNAIPQSKRAKIEVPIRQSERIRERRNQNNELVSNIVFLGKEDENKGIEIFNIDQLDSDPTLSL